MDAAGLLDGAPEALPDAAALQAAVEGAMPLREAPQQTSSIRQYREANHLRLTDRDYAGSLGAVKRLDARDHREHGVRAQDIALPVVTKPGDVAQVDFG